MPDAIPYWEYHQDPRTVLVSSWDLLNDHPGFIVRAEVFPVADGDHYVTAILAVDPETSEDELVTMYEHELGHVLGLGHDEDVRSIMYPLLNESGLHFMQYDLSFVRQEMGHATNSSIPAH